MKGQLKVGRMRADRKGVILGEEVRGGKVKAKLVPLSCAEILHTTDIAIIKKEGVFAVF